MIEIIKELNIEVSKPNIFQAVVAKQYDMNTRFIKATFVDDGDVIYIPNGDTVKVVINAERPDGVKAAYEGDVLDDGTVRVPLHSEMLEIEGMVICDISVIDTEADDNKKLTTTAFNLLVEKAAYGGNDVTNDPQYDVLVSLLETCNEAGTVAQEALEKSNEANAKYEACVEATERANQAADGVVTIEQNKQTPLKFWVGTQEEYDAIVTKTHNCFYIISDDPSMDAIADKVTALEEEVQEMQDEIIPKSEIYPVGSVYCSSTNTNPGSEFGGTWELIDKSFKSSATNDATQFLSADTESITCNACSTVRSFSTVRIRCAIKIDVDLSDTGQVLGNFDFSKVGISGIPMGYTTLVTANDGANGAIVWSLSYDGVVSQGDVLNQTTIKGGHIWTFDVMFNMGREQMLDEFCDKFYWKRTA